MKPKIGKGVLIAAAIPLAVLLLLVVLFSAIAGISWLEARNYDRKMQKEVTGYVLANKEQWEQGELKHKEKIQYHYIGYIDTGIEYGYYYSEDDTHRMDIAHGEKYRDGYRYYCYPYEPSAWLYSVRICENWYYYEIHGF